MSKAKVEANQEITGTAVVAAQATESNLMTEDNLQKYYSVVPTNRQEAMLMYNAINNPEHRVADFINKTIAIKHVLIENVELDSKENPFEKDIVPRTIFIDTEGKSFVAVSFGVFNSVKRIIQMFGEPSTWDEPVTVEVKQIKKGENSILTLNIVG